MGRFVLCGLLLIVARPALGQTLTWKWKEGETFYVLNVTRTKQTLRIEDPRVRARGQKPGKETNQANVRDVRQEFEQGILLSYAVQKVNKDGSARIVQTVERVVVKEGPRLSRPDTSLVGTKLILHVTARGEVTRVEGHAKLLDRLAGGDSGKRALFKQAVSESSLKTDATRAFGFLVAKPLKKGLRWKRPAGVALGPLGHLKTERTYAYEGGGAKKEPVTISFTTVVTGYELAKGDSELFQIVRGKFEKSEGKGSLKFDPVAGRLLEATSTLKLKGDLTIKSGDTEYRTHLTQEQTSRTKVMDKLPK